MKKVRIEYSDGEYSLTAYMPEHAELNLAFVEISDGTWLRWQYYCDAARRWHDFCRDLGNEQYYKDNPTEVES